MRASHHVLPFVLSCVVVAGCSDSAGPDGSVLTPDAGLSDDSSVTQGSKEDGGGRVPDAGSVDASLPDAFPSVEDAAADTAAEVVDTGIDASIEDATSDSPVVVDAARDAGVQPSPDATVCTTPAAPDVCGSKCTDFTSDRDNCGTCGNACPDCWVCSNSACTVNPLPPSLCEAGDDLVDGECYRACPGGYSPDRALCRQDCPSGWTDTHETCTKAGASVAKGIYGRAASNPTYCSNGQNIGGACYPYCRAGYTAKGLTCWGKCPAGTQDNGTSCNSGGGHYPHSEPKPHYERTTNGAPDRCNTGLEKVGALCYSTCQSGDSAHGTECWTACPSAWTDLGAACAPPAQVVLKNTSARAAYPTNRCAVGH
jgi:hypothetical protein